MQLQLLDIETYITKNNLQPVSSTGIYTLHASKFDPKGLWSEDIFGRLVSNDRRSKFGYIDLNCEIINPIIYDMLISMSPVIRSIIMETKRYNLSNNKLIESEIGQTGIQYLISIINDMDFTKICKPNKLNVAEFLNKNKKLLIISKFLVLPAGIRDLSLFQSKSKQFSSEINELYQKLLMLVNQKGSKDDGFDSIFITYIQKTAITIFKWIQSKVKGKQGLFQGTMLKKTIDFSARVVAISDPNIPLGTIGVPWHTVLTLYQPFFINKVYKDVEVQKLISEFMTCKLDDINDPKIQEFNQKINKHPKAISPESKEKLIAIAKEISFGKDILCKRDPVERRNSYYSASIEVLSEGRAAVVNSLSVTPQGLDFDGDTIALIPVFTNEALKEAEKLNPAKSKSAWMDPVASGHHYPLTLDSISTIYAATKT